MAVLKQSAINRIRRQREFHKKEKRNKEEKIISEEEHEERLNKLKELGLIK